MLDSLKTSAADWDADSPPGLEFLFEARVKLHLPAMGVGPAPGGNRVIFLVKGGEFEGPHLHGRVVPDSGADWVLIRPDGVGVLDVRFCLETHDNALLYLHWQGRFWSAPEDAEYATDLEKPDDPAGAWRYYFRSAPQFETGDPRYAWLNDIVAVNKTRTGDGGPIHRVFAVKRRIGRGSTGPRARHRSRGANAPVGVMEEIEPMGSQQTGISESDALSRLRALNARFIHNFVTNDVASHRRITHEDFVCITPKGAREGRAEYLARWATGFDPDVITYWDYRDERISVFGPVALVWSANKHTVVRDGDEATGMTAYTDTYVLEDGEWRCIQAQLTPVAPENYPPDQTIVRKYIRGELQR